MQFADIEVLKRECELGLRAGGGRRGQERQQNEEPVRDAARHRRRVGAHVQRTQDIGNYPVVTPSGQIVPVDRRMVLPLIKSA